MRKLKQKEFDTLINDVNYIKFLQTTQSSPFHMVAPSPWPFLVSLSLLTFVFGNVLFFQSMMTGWIMMCFSLFFLILYLFRWFSDILLESYDGHHVEKVVNGLSLGFLLMMLSEIMFFFSFFWCFFHMTFSLSVFTGLNWPYMAYPSMYLPLLNTLILSMSSWTLTQAQNCFMKSNKLRADSWTKEVQLYRTRKYNWYMQFYLSLTLFLGVWFSWMQAQEYCDAKNLTFNNGCAGSMFYMLTGFHGLHVIMGSIFMFMTFISVRKNKFFSKRFVLLEMTSLYWHFVDVVWWFLFLFVYL